LQLATQAEWPGLAFFNAAGRYTFLDRDWRTRAPYTTSQATFGDDPTANELPYDNLVISYDESFLYNDVRVTRTGADLPKVATDSTSQTRYLQRTLEESDVIVVDDTQAQVIADAKLARFKDPFLRVTQISFPITDQGDALQQQLLVQALMREIGDQITIKRRPKGGAVITQSSYIESIKHDIDFENKSWNVTFAVSPR
jgi:hypothetical protein